MSNHSPILSPPPELVEQWLKWLNSEEGQTCDDWVAWVAVEAARWGADQELEACCEWFICDWTDIETADKLRAARRPRPPSLKEQALEALEVIPKLVGFESERDAIRRALDALDD